MLTGVHQNHASAQIPDRNTLQRFDKQQNDPGYPGPDVWAAGPENPLHVFEPIRIEHLPDFHHRAKYEGPKSASECAWEVGARCVRVRWDDDRLAMRPGRTYVATVPGIIPLKGPTSDTWWAPKVTCRLVARHRAGVFDSPPGVTCIHTAEPHEYAMEWVIGGEAIGIDGIVQGVYRGAIPVTVEGPDGRWTAVIPVEYTVGARINECTVAGEGSLDFEDVEQGESSEPIPASAGVKITITGGDTTPHVSVSSPVDEWSHDGNSPVAGPGFELSPSGPTEQRGSWIYMAGGTVTVPSSLALGSYEATVTVSVTCLYH